MGLESIDVVRFNLGSLVEAPVGVAKLKSACIFRVIGLGGLNCETRLEEIIGCDSINADRFDLHRELLVQGQMGC